MFIIIKTWNEKHNPKQFWLVRDGPIFPTNTYIRLVILKAGKEQRAFGVDIGNNAISYSFDFAVDANEEFELSLRNRGWYSTGKCVNTY